MLDIISNFPISLCFVFAFSPSYSIIISGQRAPGLTRFPVAVLTFSFPSRRLIKSRRHPWPRPCPFRCSSSCALFHPAPTHRPPFLPLPTASPLPLPLPVLFP